MKDDPDFNIKHPEPEWVSYGVDISGVSYLCLLLIILFIVVSVLFNYVYL